MNTKRFYLATLAVALFLAGCGVEESAGPVSGAVDQQYVFAANNANPGELYRYSVTSGTIDTANLGITEEIVSMVVSRQREELLAVTPGAILIISTDSMAVVDQIPVAGVYSIEVSSSGSFITTYQDSTLEIFRLADRQSLRTIVKRWGWQNTRGTWGASDSTYLMLTTQPGDRPNKYEVPVLGGEYTWPLAANWNYDYIARFGLAPSERQFFAMQGPVGLAFSQLQIFDLDLDSMIFWLAVPSSATHAAQTPDRNRVFVTASEPPPIHPAGQQASGLIWEYEFDANTIVRTINTYNIPVDSGAGRVDISWVTVTPDGKHLIGMSQYGGGYLLDYNLQTYQVNRLLDLGETGGPWIMSN